MAAFGTTQLWHPCPGIEHLMLVCDCLFVRKFVRKNPCLFCS